MFNLNTYEFKLVEGYNLQPDQELAARFTPGSKPTFGEKRPIETMGCS